MKRASRRALHLVLALAIGGSGFDALAHQRTAPGEAFYERLAAGEKAAAGGDLEAAGRAYEQAYEALPAADRGTDTGTDVVLESVRARRELFLQDPDTSVHLHAAEVLLASHIANLKAADPARATTDLDKLLDAIRKLLAKIEKPEPEPEPEPEPVVPPPVPTTVTDQPTRSTDPARTKKLGLGLTIGGGGVLAGGVLLLSLSIYRFSVTKRNFADGDGVYSQECTDADEPYDQCDLEQYRDNGLKLGRQLLGGGVALTVVGVASLVPGLVLLKRSKKSANMGFLPAPFHRGAGIAMTGRF